VTGSVPAGQIVFTPAAVRIGGHDLKAGTVVQPGTLVKHGTSDEPAITVLLSPAQLPTARVGDSVVVTLPDGNTRPGKITVIGAAAVAAASSGGTGEPSGTTAQSSAPVTIIMKDRVRGFLDQAQVQVAITVDAHKNAFDQLPGDRTVPEAVHLKPQRSTGDLGRLLERAPRERTDDDRDLGLPRRGHGGELTVGVGERLIRQGGHGDGRGPGTAEDLGGGVAHATCAECLGPQPYALKSLPDWRRACAPRLLRLR
jgi:hypothetical protein